MIDAINLCDVTSEAGILATLAQHPDFIFYSEHLTPEHFSSPENAQMYRVFEVLAKKEIPTIDAYNITTAMSNLGIKEIPSPKDLDNYLDDCRFLSRSSVSEYKLLVDNVTDKAFRRKLLKKLRECEAMCGNTSEKEIQKSVYDSLDTVMMQFGANQDIPEYKNVVDEMFHKIEECGNDSGEIGWEFKFPTLNKYCTIDRQELVVVAGQAKAGKSLFLTNIAVDLLEKGASVLYLDSELSTMQFTIRLLAHLTGIPYARIKHLKYSEEERERLLEAKEHMKTWRFTHLYMPVMTDHDIYMTFKKVLHQRGVDVFILDYIKSSSDDKVTEATAMKTYTALGNRVNMIKNTICGKHNVAGLAAVQLTDRGTVADSSNIVRFSSSTLILRDKTEDEIEEDGGDQSQSKALQVFRNRNGEQDPNRYISLRFDKDRISFEEPVEQPKRVEPF